METHQALRGPPDIHLRCIFVSTEGWSDYIAGFCVAVILLPCWHRAHWWGFSTPLLLCHRQKTPNLQWRLSSALNEFQITGVLFWGRLWKAALSPAPPLLLHPHHICASPPMWVSICMDKWKQTRPRCVFRCQIHFQCGLGSRWNYVMIARNNWERRQKWSYTEIIIITLKDLQWQSNERQQGLCVIVGQIVPSIDSAEKQKEIQSKQYM